MALTVWAPHGERLWAELEGGERIELERDAERGELWHGELAPVAPGDRYLLHTGWGGGESWRCVFNSQAEAYGGWAGSGPERELTSDEQGHLPLTLPKWSVLALELCG